MVSSTYLLDTINFYHPFSIHMLTPGYTWRRKYTPIKGAQQQWQKLIFPFQTPILQFQNRLHSLQKFWEPLTHKWSPFIIFLNHFVEKELQLNLLWHVKSVTLRKFPLESNTQNKYTQGCKKILQYKWTNSENLEVLVFLKCLARWSWYVMFPEEKNFIMWNMDDIYIYITL